MPATIQDLSALNREIAMCIESARILRDIGRDDLADGVMQQAEALYRVCSELRAQQVAA